MAVEGYIAVIPSSDLQRSNRLWTEGLGYTVEDAIDRDGVRVWCMLSGPGGRVMLNIREGEAAGPEGYEGIRLYWTPTDLDALHARLRDLGFAVSDIVVRDYGMREFALDDDDGHNHCFGVPAPAAP